MATSASAAGTPLAEGPAWKHGYRTTGLNSTGPVHAIGRYKKTLCGFQRRYWVTTSLPVECGRCLKSLAKLAGKP